MPDLRSEALRYAKENNSRFFTDLNEFLTIPSISTDPGHAADMEQAAKWVARKFEKLNLANIKILPTGGHPVVYAELNTSVTDAPTILVYGHYDVQPAEPLELWTSGAFEPEQRGENLYARGASDMKGQVCATINALEAVLEVGASPVKIKFLVEGESRGRV